MIRLILWILALCIAPWIIVAVILVGLYYVTIHAPGLTFAFMLALFTVGIVKFLQAREAHRDVHDR